MPKAKCFYQEPFDTKYFMKQNSVKDYFKKLNSNV